MFRFSKLLYKKHIHERSQMNQLKLSNNTKYDLITNGVEESGDYLTLSFLPGLDSFETVESEFSPLNTGKIYILGLDGHPMEVKTGFTQLAEMQKKIDYVISYETVNAGTEEEPNYETNEVKDTIMVAKLRRPDIRDTVQTLQDTVDAMILSQLEV
ncbi:hypothetical protein [Enterocloster bolteae]|uniref:hypothetical protein n=2 Tax=Enterocloster bolteae TaxID=208479 RepID=UPI001F42D9D2|nr:hypothetical protein [Enterocloster bolteae]